MIVLVRECRNLGFGNIMELGSPAFFEIFARPLAWILYFFLTQIFLPWVVVEKEYMKHDMKKFVNIVSRACFIGAQSWLVQLSYSFLARIFLQ